MSSSSAETLAAISAAVDGVARRSSRLTPLVVPMLREGDCLLLVEVKRQRELLFAKHKKPSAILMQRAILDELVDVMARFIIHVQLNQRLRAELFCSLRNL